MSAPVTPIDHDEVTQHGSSNGNGFLTPKPQAPPVELAETRGFRLKNKLLGPALNNDRLQHERLGKPTALAVFASDNLSSSAYATEEILKVLVPAVGVAAFALVVPVTVALLVVLGFLILSYRQTIKAYPTAGGAYIVTRDNFGLLPAQVAGVALLTDYILTVSVSVAAGTAAIASAAPALEPYTVPISVLFIAVIAYGNLRGVKESGRIFAIPTYFFIVDMVVLLGYGLYRMLFTTLPVEHAHRAGMVNFGHAGGGLLMGAALYKVLTSFANGGAAVTGVEAISNGVPAFRVPEWRNARETLVIMGTTLGAMFLGLSVLAAKMHVAPYEKGTPTVISQIGKLVYGKSGAGTGFYLALQAGTALILILAANTSFADFPRLASFHAGDNFMPRQLTKRGHRLVFSNGIISLAVASIVLVIVSGAKVDNLIGLYAIGVFTSFTLSQGGMAKHHITHKEPGWQSGPVHQRHRGVALPHRRHHHRRHQVHPRRVDRGRAGAGHGGAAGPAEPGVRGRGDRVGDRRCRVGRGARDAPSRGAGLHRPAQRGRGPSDPICPDALARRTAGRSLRPRPDPHRGPDRGLGASRIVPPPARRGRVPRAPAWPGALPRWWPRRWATARPR